MKINDTKQLIGNYVGRDPININGNEVSLLYDSEAFQLTGDNKNQLSLKQLFSEGNGISIAQDTTDTTKQLLSAKVDGSTVKFNDKGQITSQLLSVDAAGPLVIGSDSKLSINVDGSSVKIVDGKLSSGIVGSGPIGVVSSTADKNTTISLAYDKNTLELKDNKLSAK